MEEQNIDKQINKLEISNLKLIHLNRLYSFAFCTIIGTCLFLFFLFFQTKFGYEFFKNYLNLEIIIYITGYSLFICPIFLKFVQISKKDEINSKRISKSIKLSKVILFVFFVLLVIDCFRLIYSANWICPITINFCKIILNLDIGSLDISGSNGCLSLHDFICLLFFEVCVMFIYCHLKNSSIIYSTNKFKLKNNKNQKPNNKNFSLRSKFSDQGTLDFENEYLIQNYKNKEINDIFQTNKNGLKTNFSL